MQGGKNTTAASQAWRKKPRKFAPKSRQGCKTCKIRRVKCDLSRPSCLKCQSTGRKCDGYGESPPSCGSDTGSSRCFDGKLDSYPSCTAITVYHQNQMPWHAEDNHCLSLQNPGPLMILPLAGPAQIEAMGFFEDISIKHLNKYRPRDEPWRKTLMFFSQTVPSVRHAATALALLHRNYLDGGSGFGGLWRGEPSRSSRDSQLLDKEGPLFHYTLAIQLLLNQDFSSYSRTESTAITLLVCYLFTCFDHLAGEDVQAMRHLRGGVELSRNLEKAMLCSRSSSEDSNSSEVGALVLQVTSQIRRLDMQAVMFLLDWTPADVGETITLPPACPDGAFESLAQAADHIQLLIARVMTLRNTEQEMYPMGKRPPPPPFSSLGNTLLGQLERWSVLFESMLQLQQGSSNSYETDPGSKPLVALLRVQCTIAWILLSSSHGPGGEMEYDAFLPQFQRCAALASDVAAAHERYSGSLRPTFTPEIGILPVLYIIGAKCRHGLVRREVLRILRRQPIREAVWNSICTARVLERVIEIEEGGNEAPSMDQIAVWQRIEAVSWIHVVTGPSAPRLDVTYTFCTREGIHTESLQL